MLHSAPRHAFTVVPRNNSKGSLYDHDGSAASDRSSVRGSGRGKTELDKALRADRGSMLDLTLPFSHGTSLLRRVFSEGFLLLRLGFRLYSYLGMGWKWSMQLLRLVLYATLLLPGFIQMIIFYVFSPRVMRSVVYGPKPRQRLDLYFPPDPPQPPATAHPVVIYVTGGAWTIGYKAWGALLARRLSEQGVLVACLDYRNFPQGDALDMLEDVNTGIAWVLDNIARYGGDPRGVTLVGQSAGGHLAGLALLRQAEQAALGSPALGAYPAWSPSCLRSFVGVSGAYDLEHLAEHLHRRGLYKNLLERIMSLEDDNRQDGLSSSGSRYGTAGGGATARGDALDAVGYAACSIVATDCDRKGCAPSGDTSSSVVDGGPKFAAGPEGVDQGLVRAGSARLGNPHDASGCRGGARPAYDALSPVHAAGRLPRSAAAELPEVLLIHGTSDKTVPHEGSMKLVQALKDAGVPEQRCRCLLVPGKTHTAFLIEDPMRGGRDLLMDTVLGAVRGGAAAGEDPERHVYDTLCPGLLCDLAGWVCPF
ncbi:hypothetical protein GPECTOR_5g342 [Gonium pectorale]|uniref:protein-S-isoprenylcysteine alpha-carbonyl methylesterase n=1 Tax=Gonium pectorale TaxID=33097 RepID=A0A150GX41_GONPE|nr:hypothetical protein GPECTOR_5g342 [Gonium pectorale]|eukprot:KXZ54252.1 hypothetical protein GPECTOR_5g342 [Gonium pectorale]